MTIYADQMFLENFIMNFLILYMTGELSRNEYKWYRIALSSAVGALYVICSYVFCFYDFQQIFIKILLSVVLITIAFSIKNIKNFIRVFLTFYAITFFIGGVSFGLSFLLDIYVIKENGIIYVSEFPIVLVAGAVLLSLLLIRYLMVFFRKKTNIEQFIYPIEIFIAEKKINVKAFFDSGNGVTEPLSEYPVIFLEKNVFEEILPTSIMKEIKEKTYFIEDNTWKRRFRLVPISTVNNEKTIMAGFKSDRVIIYKVDEKKEIQHAILVYCEGKFSKNGEYAALIGRKILE